MESVDINLKTSLDEPRTYHNNDTSSVKLTYGTSDTGIIGASQIGIVIPDIEESTYFWKGFRHSAMTPVRLSLQFSKKVERLIIHDYIFRKFISHIERGLNEFIKEEIVFLENTITFEEDWEVPSYEKLVLSLKFQEIPFNQEMRYWKEINTIVYGKIKSMILSSSEEDSRRIQNLKRKFFIKIKM